MARGRAKPDGESSKDRRVKSRMQLLQDWCAQTGQTVEDWEMFCHSVEGGAGREFVKVPQISLPAVLWKRVKTMIADPKCGFASDSQVVATAIADLVLRYEFMAWPDSDEAAAFKRLMKLRAEQTKHLMMQDEIRNSQTHCQNLHDGGHRDELLSYCARMRDIARARKTKVDVKLFELAESWMKRLKEEQTLEALKATAKRIESGDPQVLQISMQGHTAHAQGQQVVPINREQAMVVDAVDAYFIHPGDEGFVPLGDPVQSRMFPGDMEQLWLHPDEDITVRIRMDAHGNVVSRVRQGGV